MTFSLAAIAQWVASRPVLYEAIQCLAGQTVTRRKLAMAARSTAGGLVLDIGSAAGGMSRRVFDAPIAIDIDARSIAAMKRRWPDAHGVTASAAQLPFQSNAFPTTICVAVSHHLDDVSFIAALEEIARVTAGTFIFIDALRNDRRWISSLLWRYDRGRHPRTREQLLGAISKSFIVESTSEYSHGHQFLLCVTRPRLT